MKFEKNHLIVLSITLGIFIITAILTTQTRLLEGLENGAIDFRFYMRDPAEKSKNLSESIKIYKPNPRARQDLLIIGIDEYTIREFSDKGIQWPFPWNIHAKFTRYISSGKPLAILFDIMFLDHKPFENELIDAIKKARVSFLDYPFETETQEKQYADIKERIDLLNALRWKVGPNDRSPGMVEEVVPPTPGLIVAAKGIGYANVFPDPRTNVNRTMPLVTKLNGWYYPNIDLVIAMHYYGITMNDVEIKMGEYVKLKNIPAIKRKSGVSAEKDIMAKPNSKREIIIPIDGTGSMDINFIGGSGSFAHQSYSRFCLDGDMGKNNSLANKIIFVAAYASTGIATDEKKSPYGATFGIEHHANALNTILNQDFLYKLSDLQNAVILFMIALILGLLLPRISIIGSLVFTAAFTITYFIGSYVLFHYASIITGFATPIIQTGATFTFIITYRVLTEQKEKKYIRQTFSKFVSKTVVDDLLKHPEKLKLGGEKKILTVLFSDIRGFTTISEKLTPEKLVEHLNVYLQAMTDIVFKYDGTLDKYVGDEIMAFWGAPIELENHALNACRASLEMMEVLGKMNQKWVIEGKPALDIGIGLNTGDMVVGNMGSASRMDYTLMGDNVNLGARLEGVNKQYRTNIIISEYTYEHVRDYIIVRELDLIRVKGKQLPVRIYELLAMKQ